MTDYETVRYEPGRIARVILNRPEKQNAQSWRMLEEMEDAFVRAVEDDECRVIVLSGAGRSFSAGHDLDSDEQTADREAREGGNSAFRRTERYRDVYLDSHLRWRDLPKPTVAMVHGYCIFGGWMIAAAMDVIFAADDALFIPVYGDYFTAHWDVGARKAKEILYENRFMTAQEALLSGFVNRLAPADELEGETMKFAERTAENSPFLNRQIKFSINQALDNMGFTASVRQTAPDFFRMARRQRREEERAEAERRGDGRFRGQVGRALDHLREDGLAPEE